jgi:hypothetical protein
MEIPRLNFTVAVVTLAALMLFVWLQPLGYLGSGLLGAFGAKLVSLDEDENRSTWFSGTTVAVLKFCVISFSLGITIARHFGALPGSGM